MADEPEPEELVPLTDEEWLRVRGGIADRLGLLLDAYHRGMVVARDDEEREILAELAALVGPPRRPRA